MSMIFGEWDWDMYIKVQREEAAEDNAIENARNLLKKSNLSAEMIADCCSLPLEEVRKLEMELKSTEAAASV